MRSLTVIRSPGGFFIPSLIAILTSLSLSSARADTTGAVTGGVSAPESKASQPSGGAAPSASTARAAAQPGALSDESTRDGEASHERCPYDHRYFKGGGIDILPRYFHLQDKTSSAYTQGGFNSPSSDYFGLGLIFYQEFLSGWQLGVSLDWLGSSQDTGSNEASFNQGYFGIYFARNFTPHTPWDLTLGTVVGYGYATMEVLSPALNGRMTEDSAILEPRLGLAYRVADRVKLGGMVSYLFPFAPSTSNRGQSLGLDRISAQGFSASLQLIFGHWGDS